jgi:hypothetical protein
MASIKDNTDQEGAAKFVELDMVAADLERANSRVAAVEQRNVCQFLAPFDKL